MLRHKPWESFSFLHTNPIASAIQTIRCRKLTQIWPVLIILSLPLATILSSFDALPEYCNYLPELVWFHFCFPCLIYIATRVILLKCKWVPITLSFSSMVYMLFRVKASYHNGLGTSVWLKVNSGDILKHHRQKSRNTGLLEVPKQWGGWTVISWA